MDLQVITNSRLTCFRECARKHYYNYIRLRRPRVTARALAVGDVVHAGLEAWFLSRKRGDAPDHALELMLIAAQAKFAKAHEGSSSMDVFDLMRANVMLEAYHQRWWNAESWKILAVEAKFQAPLVNPATGRRSQNYVLGGKQDLLVEAEDGAWIVEHKTSSVDLGAGSVYWEKLKMDPQVSLYTAGAKAMGVDVVGVIYDVLRKPAMRPLLATPMEKRTLTKGKPCKSCKGTGQSPTNSIVVGANYACAACEATPGWAEEPRPHAGQRLHDETLNEFGGRLSLAYSENPASFFARAEVIRTQSEIDDHAFDVWQDVRAMHEGWTAGRFPRNPNACHAHGTCAYWTVCTGSASIDDDVLFRDAVTNEELQEAAAEETTE